MKLDAVLDYSEVEALRERFNAPRVIQHEERRCTDCNAVLRASNTSDQCLACAMKGWDVLEWALALIEADPSQHTPTASGQAAHRRTTPRRGTRP
jgi:hypothetical protein